MHLHLRRAAAAASALLLGATLTPMAGAAEAPEPARPVIAEVNRAAAKRDYVALKALMVSDFTWSFGGDGSSEQAIEEWKSKPLLLAELSKVTHTKCGYITSNVVQCPKVAKKGFRAGFKEVDGSWRMVYFVSGD